MFSSHEQNNDIVLGVFLKFLNIHKNNNKQTNNNKPNE